MPLNSLKFLGDNYMPLSEIFNSMENGFKCLMGQNSVVEHCSASAVHPGLPPCDNCSGSWVPIAIYLSFNCTYNIIIVLFVKYFGAAYLYAIMTLRLPLLQLAFAISFINNPPETIKWEGILGLFLIVSGIIAYRWSSTADQSEHLILPNLGAAVKLFRTAPS